MYKVFFKDRTLFLSDNFNEAFRNNSGLFYRYENNKQLLNFLDAYRNSDTIKSLTIFHDKINFLQTEFLSCFKFIKASGGLVYNSKGEFLIIKRNGIWDLPKGKAEKGETSAETAIREVSEECGITSLTIKHSLIRTYHTYTLNDTHILKETEWFEMFTNAAEKTSPQELEGITEVKWVDKSKASFIRENTFPSIVDVLEVAGVF